MPQKIQPLTRQLLADSPIDSGEDPFFGRIISDRLDLNNDGDLDADFPMLFGTTLFHEINERVSFVLIPVPAQ